MTWTDQALRIVASAAVAGVLAGCSDSEATPEDPPTSSAMSEPSSPATPESTEPPMSAPQMPPSAMEAGRKGAKAFIEYYVELVNYARMTGDSAPLLANAGGCQGCSNFADLYERTYEAGGYFRGAGWSVTAAIPYDHEKGYQVVTVIDVAAGEHRESDASRTEKLQRKELQFRFVVSRDREGWLVNEMTSTST